MKQVNEWMTGLPMKGAYWKRLCCLWWVCVFLWWALCPCTTWVSELCSSVLPTMYKDAVEPIHQEWNKAQAAYAPNLPKQWPPRHLQLLAQQELELWGKTDLSLSWYQSEANHLSLLTLPLQLLLPHMFSHPSTPELYANPRTQG